MGMCSAYNIMQMGPGPEGTPGEFLGDNPNEFATWLNDHADIHNVLRELTNVSGIDLSLFDIRSPDQWYLWQQAHAEDHAQFDAALGTA
jgi:hypothetical protein